MISKTVKFMLIAGVTFGLSQAHSQERHSQRNINPEEVFETLDVDDSGSVSLDEFKAKSIKDESRAERREAHFKTLDSDGNGELVLQEFVARQNMTKEERMKERFSKIDTDRDGNINYEEYKVFVEEDLKRRSKRRPKRHKRND